jgi:hypothetical protein
MATYDFGCEVISDFTFDHCWKLLGQDRHQVHCALDGPDIDCQGTLWEATSPSLRTSSGRRISPDRSRHLFLEDIGEHPYASSECSIIAFAGVLAPAAGAGAGFVQRLRPMPNDNGYDFAAMVTHARERFDVPIYTGLPFGHCADKLTLPVGGQCALNVRSGTAQPCSRITARRADGAASFSHRLAEWARDEPQRPSAIRCSSSNSRCQISNGMASTPVADMRWPRIKGNAIGCGRLLPDGHIGRMAVDANWRGRGVGKAILERLIELARELGIPD